VTTIRYTLPRSVGQAGCQLYSEGHFSIPASLVGPAEVGGGRCMHVESSTLKQTIFNLHYGDNSILAALVS
jgi:hypothetical protein